MSFLTNQKVRYFRVVIYSWPLNIGLPLKISRGQPITCALVASCVAVKQSRTGDFLCAEDGLLCSVFEHSLNQPERCFKVHTPSNQLPYLGIVYNLYWRFLTSYLAQPLPVRNEATNKPVSTNDNLGKRCCLTLLSVKIWRKPLLQKQKRVTFRWTIHRWTIWDIAQPKTWCFYILIQF